MRVMQRGGKRAPVGVRHQAGVDSAGQRLPAVGVRGCGESVPNLRGDAELLVGKARGEFKAGHGGSGPYVKRFSNPQIWLHVSIVLSFLLLSVTGLPLKFAAAPWAGKMMSMLGGPHAAGLLHRFAAIVTFGYFAVHLFMVLWGSLVKGEKGFFWGWRSMVPLR